MSKSSPVNPPEPYTIDAPTFRTLARFHKFGQPGTFVTDWKFVSDRPHRCRRLIERMAWFLKRERELDFPPYTSESTTPNTKAHLFSYDFDVGRSRAIGAVSFAWNEWSNHPPGYCLEWVWLHPYFRRQGILSQSWNSYRNEYGDFAIGPPYSPAMLDFLIKVDHPHDGIPWKNWKQRLFDR